MHNIDMNICYMMLYVYIIIYIHYIDDIAQ